MFGIIWKMKHIKLTKNYYTIVDDEDFEYLNQYNWHVNCIKNHVCAVRTESRKLKYKYQRTIYMHREIMGLMFGDKRLIDHINGNSLDNRKCNLRICLHKYNMRNRKPQKGVSKYKGVNLDKKGKWKVQISYNGKIIYGGRFINEIEAAKRYNELAVKYHGKFAKLNIIGGYK